MGLLAPRPKSHGGYRVKEHDSRARFDNIVLPHLADAFSLARSLTGNRADAEDVVQEACLRAFRALGTVTVGNARAWVLTIVHNTAYSWLRKNRPAAVVAVDDLVGVEEKQLDAFQPDQPTPEMAIIAKADGARVEN